MIEMTCNDRWKINRYYEFNCCKYHITVLIYNLTSELENKLKFNSYEEFRKYCLSL